MALQNTINNLKDLLGNITSDLHKAEGGNKAAAQRVRTMTVRFEKVAKNYRKDSINSEKQNKGVKKGGKKAAAKPKTKPVAKPAAKSAKVPAKAATKSLKPKAKSAVARPRAFSLKRPTAKLPTRRPSYK